MTTVEERFIKALMDKENLDIGYWLSAKDLGREFILRVVGFMLQKGAFTLEKTTYVKVIHFPSDRRINKYGESMWVRIDEGNQKKGTGYIENIPMFSSLKCGDKIEFDHGTDKLKPKFVKYLPDEGDEPVQVYHEAPFELLLGLPYALDHKLPEFLVKQIM